MLRCSRIIFSSRLKVSVASAAICAGTLLIPSVVWAIPPAIARQYQPGPPGMSLFSPIYAHATSNTSLNTAVPLLDSAGANINAVAPIYLRYFEAAGNTGYIYALWPWANVSAHAKSPYEKLAVSKSKSGLGDPTFGVAYGYLGAPAMTPQQLMKWKQTTTLNAAFYASPPLGSYERSDLINIGTNRWEFKPELTFAHRTGGLLSELYGNVCLFSDNNEFLGSNTLRQNPLYGLDAHFSYDLNPGAWGSFDVYQRWGGKTSVNSLSRNNNQDCTTLGFTLYATMSPSNVLYLIYGHTVSGGSNPNISTIAVLYGKVW